MLARLLAAAAVIVGTFAGWLMGLVVYQLVAVTVYHHAVSSADTEAMGFWLVAATAMTLPFVHLPVVSWLHRHVPQPSARAIRAVMIGMALGPLPAALLALMWSSGRLSSAFTPECALATVWAAFIGAGLMTPAAWFAETWVYWPRPVSKRL